MVLVLVMFCFFIGAVLFRLKLRRHEGAGSWVVWMALPLVGFFYYLVIWGYGMLIYPYIPTAKGGGGDFRNDAPVLVSGDIARKLKLKGDYYVLIAETDKSVFIAKQTSEFAKWGKPLVGGMGVGREKSVESRPKEVLELPKSRNLVIIHMTRH